MLSLEVMHGARTMGNWLYILATIKDCNPKICVMDHKKYCYNNYIDLFFILSIATNIKLGILIFQQSSVIYSLRFASNQLVRPDYKMTTMHSVRKQI